MPTYVVQRGDTLTGIARKLGLRSYRELPGYRSGDPNRIFPGEVLHYAESDEGDPLRLQLHFSEAALIIRKIATSYK